MLRNGQGAVISVFSKCTACIESNESEVVVILRVLRIFASAHLQASLVVEIDSLNVVSCVSNYSEVSWGFHFYFNEIKAFCLLYG